MPTIIEKSPLLSSLNYLKGQVLYRTGVTPHRSGATAQHLQRAEEVVAYAQQVVSDYIEYGGGGDAKSLRDATMLEIGPGDNLAVALTLLSKGAKAVTSVDAFATQLPPAASAPIYRALWAAMPEQEQRNIRDVLNPDTGSITLIPGRLEAYSRVAIESTHGAFLSNGYDIIVSRAVLEHVADLNAAWVTMVKCMKPDGQMWHKVDFRCHNFFNKIHPLYFLTLPEVRWRWISQPDPTLNRERMSSYRTLLVRTCRAFRMYATRILDDKELIPHVEHPVEGSHYDATHLHAVQQIRPTLDSKFRNLSDLDLLVNGIFLTAKGKLMPEVNDRIFQ